MKAALFALWLAAAAAQDGIPKHPRELKYEPLSYAAPRAADYRHKLASGPVAFLVEDHDFPLINIAVLVRAGEYLDPSGKVGLAQLVGSQMRSGGTKSKPPSVFDEEAAFLAANIASGIGSLEGSASLNCLRKDIDAGLALFTDMLRNPGFAEDRLKLAKSQLLQSMERRNDSTASIEAREFARLLRGEKHFSTAQVTKASLEAITRQDLIDFHSKYYFPANFVLAVSGDFQTKDMLARLEKAFQGWPNRSEPVPPVPKPDYTLKPGVYVVDKKDVNQTRVRMGHLGVMITNPDHLAISMMNAVLGGGGFTSRIMTRVRSDEGLAYQASSQFLHGTYYEGTFSVVFQSKNASAAQAIAIVEEEIEKIRQEKVSEDELRTEVNQAVDVFPRRFATAGLKVSQFANDYFAKLPEDYWQKYRDRLRALTRDDIQRVARQYLHPEKLVILAVGNVDEVMKCNPDKPRYSVATLAGERGIARIPLPDPLTMVYPKNGTP
jgi:zinc protease